MNYKLRLDANGIYVSDLQTIIDSIKVNGNKVTCDSVLVSHPKGAEVKLHMNLGLETNSNNPPALASLNILGFKSKGNQNFIFDIDSITCDEIKLKANKLNINLSYKSLGYSMTLPSVTDENLFESITILNSITNESTMGQKEYDALARLIVVSSEAIRFTSVANGVNKILGNENSFTPNLFEIIGWGGHSVAS